MENKGKAKKESFFQKLQRVRGKDIAHIFLFLLAWPISFIYKRFRKDLWLICDKENEARDNGYWLFRYIMETHPERDVIYAINKKSPDYGRVKPLGRVVQFGSFRHWIYYLTASKNISSQKDGKPDAAVCYVLEVYGILKNTRVFLQHGVILNDLPFLHFKNAKMRLFICSTDKEYQFVSGSFGYPQGHVVKAGLCRFDNLTDCSGHGKDRKILVMPTWRDWISNQTSRSYQYEDVSDFRNTTYYKGWMGFLSDGELENILRENHLELIFYQHRGMQKYTSYFQDVVKGVRLASWPEYDVQQLLRECDMLITDYSSVNIDFAYMKKPLLYYQFDYEMYRTGQYGEGYFDYARDGFGKVCLSRQDLLGSLRDIIREGFRMPPQYCGRADEFFTFHDKNNCKRNYEAICKI